MENRTSRCGILLILAFAFFTACTHGTREGQLSSYLKSVFRNELGKEFNHFLISDLSGSESVYIGGVSTVYRLNTNLELVHNVSTNSDDCEELEDQCVNENKILAVRAVPDAKLILCHGYDGYCELRNLMTLSRIALLYDNNFQVIPIDYFLPVVGLVGTYSGDPYLYVAVSGEAGKVHSSPVRLLTKRLLRTDFIFNTIGDPSSQKVQAMAVSYLQGMIWNDFVFFLVNEMNPPLTNVSKLGRLCSRSSSDSVEAYLEIILTCGSGGLIQAAHIGSAGSQLAASWGISAGDGVLFAAFSNDTHSSLCLYTMERVQDEFTDAAFGCSSNQDTGDLGAPILYFQDTICLKARTLGRDDINTAVQCSGDISPNVEAFRYAQTSRSWDGNQAVSGLQGEVASIITMTKENYTVAFITSTEGMLSKVHMESDDSSRVYERIDLNAEGTVLTDIYLDEQQEELYILTSEELIKLDVINCAQHTTCDECIRPTAGGGDPFCGWCTLETKCSRRDKCSRSNETLGWLGYNEQCIDITDIEPPSLYIESPVVEINFTVTQLPVAVSPLQYSCRFDDIIVAGTEESGIFTCKTPLETQRPAIPDGADHVTMTLGVYASETAIVEEEYPFYDCELITSCFECTSRPWGCGWCVYDHSCSHDTSSCSANNDTIVQSNNSCPQLTQLPAVIYVPVGQSRSITLPGMNLPTVASRVNYTCLLNIQGTVTKVNVRDEDVTESNFTCQASMYEYDTSGEEGGILELPVSIQVEYNPGHRLDDADDATVTLYDCSVAGASCSSCITPLLNPALGCGWCTSPSSSCQIEEAGCTKDWIGQGMPGRCPDPSISSIFPASGPIEGNTTLTIKGSNLGTRIEDIIGITVDDVGCSKQGLEENYVPGVSVDCMTGERGVESQGTVVVAIQIESVTHRLEYSSFSYKDPSVTDFNPKTGIEAGGTIITINGSELDTGRIHRAMVGEGECVITSVTPENIECTTTQVEDTNNASVIVSFDGAERLAPVTFKYLPNPEVTDYEPKQSITIGGIPLTVTGARFDNLQQAVLEVTNGGIVVQENCIIDTNTLLTCNSPNTTGVESVRNRRQAEEYSVAFLLDGFTFNAPEGLQYFPDPEYDVLEGVYGIQSGGETLELFGTNLGTPEDAENFVTVSIGNGTCEVTTVTAMMLSCLTPEEKPSLCEGDTGDNLCVVVRHGNSLVQNIGYVRYPTGGPCTICIVAGTVGGVIVFSILIFLLFITVGYRNYKAQIHRTETEMINLMENSKREVMEGFFIDQEMTDVQEQLSGLGMPFVSNQDYMKSMLFFGLKIKPVPTDPENPSEMEERAMMEFSKLLSKKEFLKVFINTLDGCKQISTQDKANIASLLTVVLVMEGKFRYFTDVLMTLTTESIAEAADRRRVKQLFKRTETLEDKMLNNWIALAMFKFVKESVGHPLYLLYQAIKIQCEKGPVDAITGESFFSLSFDNLLTESQEFQELTLNVETELGREPVKVLDVDTITQVKEKILDAMYRKKHTKYQRSAKDVDLVIKSGDAGQLVLSDKDNTTMASLGWCELNTLKHYGINTGHAVTLTNRQDTPNSMPIPLNEEAENLFYDALRQSRHVSGHHDSHHATDVENGVPDGVRLFHLTQALDQEDPDQEEEGCMGRMQRVLCFKGKQGRRKIREIYLQRLVSVKQSIHSFVRTALEAMFTITEDEYVNSLNNVPFALRFLFTYFDEEASRYEDESGTAIAWKNNILPLRFWSTIFAHPSFIFNMRQSRTADASVIVLNQMLDNACRGVVPTLKMNSSPSRLLFNKELPEYIELLKTYYYNIKQTPRLQEDELKSECMRIDREFEGLFSRLATLRQLYDFVRPHETMLVEALQENDNCRSAHFASSLERVGNTLDQPDD